MREATYLGEEKNELGVDVCSVSQNRVCAEGKMRSSSQRCERTDNERLTTVDSRVLEVDARLAVGADDDLELVVPSVGAGPDLDT